MIERRYSSIDDFARDFGPQMASYIGRMRAALVRETTDFMDEHSRREPEGSGPRYKYGGKQAGALKASRSVTRSDEMGALRWTAPHAGVINLGRKRSKPYRMQRKGTTVAVRGRRGGRLGDAGSRAFTRMLGSKQARGGMTRPAFRALRRDWSKVIAKAATAVEGSG